MPTLTSRGKRLWDTFHENLQAYRRGPVPGGATRPVLYGVTARGTFVGGMTLDAFLAQAGKVLLDSARVYRWEDTLCLEAQEPDDRRLLVLASRQRPEPHAASLLANLLCVGVQGEAGETQSLTPPGLVAALLADQGLWRRLPAIRTYARRPLFDAHFNLCGPGWNPDRGVLVHGPDIEPNCDLPPPREGSSALDRLPPGLRRLLGGFCWASDADLVNALALLLTGFLANHFVDDPKPIAIIDGNQKGLGKTLLVQALGRLLDNAEPPRVPWARDEELEKKLCALLRDGRSSLFFFDNVRDRVASALVEANALSPELSFRILGQSGNVSRPNTYLWVITSNQASGTEDLVSRGLPIRLRYEGDPRQRAFDDNLLDYVREFRLGLLGELAGLVLRWKQAGMPRGAAKHRCVRWAAVVGGILAAAGLEGFLGNVAEAEEAMDEGLAALTSLAEHVIGKGLSAFFAAPGEGTHGKGGTAGEWVPLFHEAEVFREPLADKSP